MERLALGGGVTLTAAGPTGAVRVGTSPGRLLLPAGAALDFTYPAPGSDALPVTWTQEVSATEDRVEVSQPWRGERPTAPGHITLAWHSTGSWAEYRTEVAAAPGLTVSAPVSLHLDHTGGLTGSVDAGFVADAHARGVEVWPAVASLDADVSRTALADPDHRAELAVAVSERSRAAGADGVNIDLEGFTHDTADAVTDFTRQLIRRCRRLGRRSRSGVPAG